MTNLNGIDIKSLRDEANFIEVLTNDALGEPVILDYWQRTYIRDARRSLVVNKSRQVGYSFIESAKGLARSHTKPDYRKYFVSINLDESKSKIRYIRQLYSSLPSQFKLRIITDAKTEIAFEDAKGRISLLKALTGREPRGMNGDISLDEFSHYLNPRKILDAAGAIGIRGGWQLSIGSSPLNQEGPFWEIVTNHQDKFRHFGAYSIPWWFSKGLCIDVSLAVKIARELPIEERVERFGTDPIKEAFRSYPRESFIQEFECGFLDEVSTFMPYDLIWSCRETNYGTDNTESEVEYLFDAKQLRETSPEITEDFWKWVRKYCTGLIEIGFDIGRKKDLTALVVTDETNGVKDVRAIVTLDRVPFAKQEHILTQALTIVKPQKCRIDNGGMGMPIAESMVTKFGTMVEPVTFTNQNKSIMASNIKARFEKKKIRIPAWLPLENNIHSIRREVSDANAITYNADATDHHGDIYWALALTDLRPMEQKAGYVPKAYREKYEERILEQKLRDRQKIL